MTEAARLFVAVGLPGDVTDALATWARRAVGARDELRRVRAGALHLTLVFLGDRPLSDADAIAAVVTAMPPEPLPLAVGAPLWLAPRRPHVLTVGIEDPAGALAALHRGTEAALVAAIGWEPEPRPFRPHVTVARVRRGARVRPVELDPPRPMRFEATGLVLYRSRLGPGGSEYEALARLDLPRSG